MIKRLCKELVEEDLLVSVSERKGYYRITNSGRSYIQQL